MIWPKLCVGGRRARILLRVRTSQTASNAESANMAEEEWCVKLEELLQTNLRTEEELRRLKTLAKKEIADTVTGIEHGQSDTSSKLRLLQEVGDNLMARSMGFSEEVQTFETRQKSELENAREALRVGRQDIEKAENSLKSLCNVFAVINDPKKVFNYSPVTFTLSNFHQRKEADEIWFSPCFYSHNCGYKMQLQVYPNGDGPGRGTHVSVKVALMPGEFDELLCWPFRGVITLYLVNQRKESRHIAHQLWFTTLETLYMREKPVVDDQEENARRVGEGVDLFAAHASLGEGASFLSETEYLKNDSLLFCVWNVDVFYHHH